MEHDHGLAIDQLAHRNDTTAFDSYSVSMGFTHRTYLGGNKIYACAVCRTHMATIESMMSRVGAAATATVYIMGLTKSVRVLPALQWPTWTGFPL